MKKWPRRIVMVVSVLVALPILLWIGFYASAFYYRWEARRFCEILKRVQVGKTTQAEYSELLRPAAWHLEKNSCDPTDCPESFGIGNRPAWTYNPICLRCVQFLDEHFFIPDILFFATPRFEGGVLVELTIDELQGSGHPFNARVDEVMQKEETSERFLDFTGYRADRSFALRKPGVVWHYFVDLDERATDEERRRALDFKFECFTSIHGCYDARKYLNPVPDRDAERWR